MESYLYFLPSSACRYDKSISKYRKHMLLVCSNWAYIYHCRFRCYKGKVHKFKIWSWNFCWRFWRDLWETYLIFTQKRKCVCVSEWERKDWERKTTKWKLGAGDAMVHWGCKLEVGTGISCTFVLQTATDIYVCVCVCRIWTSAIFSSLCARRENCRWFFSFILFMEHTLTGETWLLYSTFKIEKVFLKEERKFYDSMYRLKEIYGILILCECERKAPWRCQTNVKVDEKNPLHLHYIHEVITQVFHFIKG